MKQVQAIVQPFRVAAVVDALQVLPGVGGITSWEVRGFGHQRGADGLDRPARGAVNYTPKVMLLLTVPDALVPRVLDTLQAVAHSGNPGDGKVFVLPVEDALRVRTGERGEAAL